MLEQRRVIQQIKWTKKKTLQNKTIRRCLGLPPSTPVHILYALAGEFPVKERAEFLTAKELVNIFSSENNIKRSLQRESFIKSSYNHCYIKFKDIFDKIEVINSEECKISSKIIVEKNIMMSYGLNKKSINDEVIRSLYSEKLRYLQKNNYTIFSTDASITNQCSGCAVFDLKENNTCR